MTAVLALGLIPWIVFLALTLPPQYDATHWQLLWVGYDVAEVSVLAFAAWGRVVPQADPGRDDPRRRHVAVLRRVV